MTVKELINELNKMPLDAKVMYYDGDNGWTTVEECTHETEVVKQIYARNPEIMTGNFVILTDQ